MTVSGHAYEFLPHDAWSLFVEGLPDVTRLAPVAADLAALGYADDAAHETEALIAYVREVIVEIDRRMNRLAPVWRALDRRRAYLTGDDAALRAALAAYRDEP